MRKSTQPLDGDFLGCTCTHPEPAPLARSRSRRLAFRDIQMSYPDATVHFPML